MAENIFSRGAVATYKSPFHPLGTEANPEPRGGGDFTALEKCPLLRPLGLSLGKL